MIQQITRRLQEVNTLLATCRQDRITFEQAVPLSLFYKDFNDTNRIVTEATAMYNPQIERFAVLKRSVRFFAEGFKTKRSFFVKTQASLKQPLNGI